MDSYKRRKKSDKAKDKAGMPNSRHVRAYEALIEKRTAPAPAPAPAPAVKPGKKK